MIKGLFYALNLEHFRGRDDEYTKISMEQFTILLKGTICALLFVEGGHSLREFLLPFQIDEINQFLGKYVEGYQVPTIELLFMNDEINNTNIDIAFKKTIEFNQTLIRKKQLNKDLLRKFDNNV